MKKQTTIAIAALIMSVSTQNVSAQGFLQKLKDKVSQTAGMGSSSNADFPTHSDSEAAKDLVANDLDNISLPTDKMNINGIYIVSKPLYITDDRNKSTKATYKKVVLEYLETDNSVNMTTRDVAKGKAKKSIFKCMSTAGYEKKLINQGIILGFRNSNSESPNYNYVDQKKDSDGKVSPDQRVTDCLTLIAPGVFVFGSSTYVNDGVKTCDFVKVPEIFKDETYNIVSKTGTDISKWTPESIRKRLFELRLTQCNIALKNVDGVELPRPGNASSAALFDPAKKQVMAVVKKYLIDNDMAQLVPIYAYGHFDNAAFSDNMISHPHTGVQVSKGRIVDYIVVCKNTKPNGGSNDYRKVAKGKNVFFHINLAEDNTAMNYNSQNYTGKWYVKNCSVFSEIDESENVMKYQGK